MKSDAGTEKETKATKPEALEVTDAKPRPKAPRHTPSLKWHDGIIFENKHCRLCISYRVIAVVGATVTAYLIGKHWIEGIDKLVPIFKAIPFFWG